MLHKQEQKVLSKQQLRLDKILGASQEEETD